MITIQIEGVRKKFGKLQVLKGVDAVFQPGQVVAVVGPNASGKTTLIKCILGNVFPDEGRILVDGHDISHDFHYKSRIGYMPQIGRYPDNMTIGQLFSMMKDIRTDFKGTYDESLLEQFRLQDLSGKPMRTLSGGTRQKVSAALAFLFNPPVLILDEPTAGLDPAASEVLKDKIITSARSGKLVIVTSHLMSEVDEIANGILFMMEGVVKFHKTPSEIKRMTGEERLGKALSTLIESEDVQDR